MSQLQVRARLPALPANDPIAHEVQMVEDVAPAIGTQDQLLQRL
jgi:hypothetical protein